MTQIEKMEDLKKHKVGILGVVGIIYTMCCAGAYGLEEMISLAGPGMAILALCVLPFIWAYPQAIVTAELGSAIPEEGGHYIWMRKAFGNFWAFQVGFWDMVANYLFIPTLIVLAGNYVGTGLHWPFGITLAFKIFLILLFGFINWRGVKDVSIVSTAMSIIIFIAFMGIIVIGFTNWEYNPVEPFYNEEFGPMYSMSYAFIIGMWMYGGYGMMANVAEELEDPQVIPKALMIAMPLVMITYIPSTIGGIASVGQWESWGTDGVSWVDVGNLAGPAVGYIFVFIAFLGQVSIYNSYLGTTARTIFVMSMDKLAPKIFRRTSPKTGVPDIALLSVIITSFIFCTFEFSIIVMLTVTVGFLATGGLMLSIMVLKKGDAYKNRPVKIVKYGWMIDAMCIMVLMVCVVFLYLNGTDYFFFGTALVFVGPPLYWLLKRSYMENRKAGENVLTAKENKQFSFLFFLTAALCAGGYFFFPWFDDPYYFEEVYGIPNILQIYINGIGIMGILSAIFGVIFLGRSKKETAGG